MLGATPADRHDDADETDPGQQRPQPVGQAGAGTGGDGQQRARGELPGPGGGGEVRRGRRRRRHVEGPGEGAGGQDHHGGAQGPTGAVRRRTARREPQHHGEERRPGDVELLLDRERPEVLERGGRAVGAEVVDRLGGDVPVAGEHQRPGGVDGRVAGPRGAEDEAAGPDGHREHEHRGREEAAGSAGVEGPERDRAGALVLAEQQAGDEEAGDDEEDVDADEPARGPTRQVVGDDGEHREGPEALDVVPRCRHGVVLPGRALRRPDYH
ncbi:MAG: hypothetical protein PIR53_17175 [Nocardioides alkalitolerans]